MPFFMSVLIEFFQIFLYILLTRAKNGSIIDSVENVSDNVTKEVRRLHADYS